MKSTKRSLFTSVIAVLLCFTMLLGTTFAWFTDVVESGDNLITTGNLDIGMYWSENNIDWKNAEGNAADPIFSHDNWEPGYTEVRYIKVTNEGSLAFQYQMLINPNGEVDKLAEVIDVSIDVVTGNPHFVAPTATNKAGSLTKIGTLDELIGSDVPVNNGAILPASETSDEYPVGEVVVCITMHMQEDAGNEYQNSSLGTTFDIKLIATQFSYENDSFGNHYDEELVWPDLPSSDNTAEEDIETDANGYLLADTLMANPEGNISAFIPAGVKFENGVDKAVMNIGTIVASAANLTLTDGQQTKSYDVHVAGVATDNTEAIKIVIEAMLPVGLNASNFSLYHVENGVTITMTALGVNDEPAHNTFRYDPATGDVTLYMASFSEVALVAEHAIWKGNYDYTWYNSQSTILTISNADQLAGLSAIVGGMAKDINGDYIVNTVHNGEKIHYDSFKGKTIRLGACVHIGDIDKNYPQYTDASENGIIFYPIGYYNNTESYDKKPGNVGPDGAAVVSGFRTFEGTFDGYGHTISDWYQNTWEMFGDYNSGYSGTPNHNRDGMGLFGRVYGGTIKNLTIDNFSSDGEFSTTGCVAAYADHGATFENIVVINSNPRVYNIGNGGVVGVVGWYNKSETEQPVTFKNVTVDNSNKISALWGSWDVACGGIVGTYYPTSGQSSANYPANAGISFESCHVGAQIDVNNDVCANYQYYAYRYAGMMVGSVDENVTIDGREYPKMDGLKFTNCTVHFGDWNDYYYCELVANSLASYTHDHQMSRLEQVQSVVGNVVTYLDGTTETITGTRNFVVVKSKDGNGKWEHSDENAECYHFVNGKVWNHEEAGTEVVDGKTVLKEDKQHLYLEFNSLVTGTGWGVTSMGIKDVEGVTILDRDQANSVTKFKGKIIYPISGRVYKLSHIFDLIETEVPVISGSVDVTITNLDEGGNIVAEFNRNAGDWGEGTLVLTGRGNVRITIQDYYYCTRTTIDAFLRSYPEGSEIHNYTYDGFVNAGSFTYNINGDKIINGKHGTYYEDLGFGYETFEYAIKMDSNNYVILKPNKTGTLAIAFASANAGATLKFKEGSVSIDQDGKEKFTESATLSTVTAHKAYDLTVMYVDVTAGKTYQVIRGSLESGIYYIGYLPTGVATGFTHDCSRVVTSTTATCTESGNETTECLVCGEIGTRPVAAYGHNIVIDAGKPATCNNNGETDGQHCTRCNGEKVDKQTITKLGHNYVNSICTTCGGYNLDYEKQTYAHQMNFKNNKQSEYTEYGDYFQHSGAIDINTSNKCLALYPYSTVTGDENESYIKFTTGNSNSVLVVVAASTGYGNTSTFELRGDDGSVVTTTVKHAEGTTLAFNLKANTTYRLVCVDTARQVRIQFMGVINNSSIRIG